MGLLNKLSNQGSNLSKLNGADGPKPDFKSSQTHFKYSLNGSPNVKGKPSPSVLDLDGEVPKNNYRDNTPEGRNF